MCEPKTLIQAIAYFSDSETCNAYMRRIKWPDGKIACPHCEAGGDRIAESKARPRAPLRCRDCGKQFSYKVGTIFESSNVPLSKWFVAVWLIANSKNGISSHELGRAIGVTQRTAWFMLHRIRYAMQHESFDKFDGPSEADTTYIGGRAANMHKDRRNNRCANDGGRFKAVMPRIVGRRLTYRTLCNLDDAGFMGIS